MVVVTGGTGQGKYTYVLKKYAPAEITDGAVCPLENLVQAVCICNYHMAVKRMLEAGTDPVAFTEELCRRNPACIVILPEIGCGIIPMEKSERIWREQVGRCGCMIAGYADTVIRMTCGIPAALKGALP